MHSVVKPSKNPARECRSAVFVHGAGGGGWEWAIWQRIFAAHEWHSVAPDLQPAAAGLPATGWDDYAAQLGEWLAHAAPANIVLIGASLGGLLALQAANHPALAALVLVNPLPPRPWHQALPDKSWPAVVPWAERRSLGSTRRALPDGDDAACLHALRRWRDESGAVLNHAVAGITVARPDVPVLVLASVEDRDLPIALSRQLAQALGAGLIELPGASHVGPLLGRGAADCAERVLRWLGDLARSPLPGCKQV